MTKRKLKRCKFNWLQWLLDSGDPELITDFWNKYNHKVWFSHQKHVSQNKCAFEVLRSYYSTTALRSIQDNGVPY